MLARVVPVRFPFGSAATARRGAACVSLAIVASVIVVECLSGLFDVPMSHCSESKEDTTRLMVMEYVDEAYPLWQHKSGHKCPRSLGDLNEYTNRKTAQTAKDGVADTNDAWGRRMWLRCDGHQLEVRSAGEDGVFDTEDDVTNCDANESRNCAR